MERIAQLPSTDDQVVDIEWSGFDPWDVDAAKPLAIWLTYGVFMARPCAQRVRIHVDGQVVFDVGRVGLAAMLAYFGPPAPLV